MSEISRNAETAEQLEQRKLDEAMLNAAKLGGIYRYN